MKIGFDHIPASPVGSYSQHLAKVLGRYAPEHEYVVNRQQHRSLDLYHGFGPSLPLSVRLARVPSVVTVPNLHFLHYPQLFTRAERFFRLRACQRALRSADRLITFNSEMSEELSERLRIDPSRMEVVMPLAALVPGSEPSKAELVAVRSKYSLPDEFILMIGVVEPRHHHGAVLEALYRSDLGVGVVVCGRHTVWSDRLLQLARDRHLGARVDFLYELRPEDLPALFRLARAFVYLPDAACKASIVPLVEALRAEVPMVLSDTRIHREAAGDAAIYLPATAVDELSVALQQVLLDESCRSELRERARARAELFSEFAVAKRLIDIYSSL